MNDFFEKEDKPKDFTVVRKKHGEGVFLVIRFRNKNDLYSFSDLIDEPMVKTTPYNGTVQLQWKSSPEQRNPLNTFFE